MSLSMKNGRFETNDKQKTLSTSQITPLFNLYLYNLKELQIVTYGCYQPVDRNVIKRKTKDKD